MAMTERSKRYNKLKKRISKSIWDAVDVADEIQRDELYLEEYKTFEEFIQAELGYTKTRFYQLMEANAGKKRIEKAASKKSSMLDSKSGFDTVKAEKLKIENVSVRAAEEIGRADEKDVQKIIDKAVEIAHQKDSPLTAKIIKQASKAISEPKSSTNSKQQPQTKQQQVNALRSVALQHYKAAMRAVDDMHNLKNDPGRFKKVAALNVEIQDLVKDGWK